MILINFLKNTVIVSLSFCVVYGVIAVIFPAITGSELSPTLTERWFTVFGVELLATMVIQITKLIVDRSKLEHKIKILKENGIEITREDLDDDSNPYYDNPYYDEDMM